MSRKQRRVENSELSPTRGHVPSHTLNLVSVHNSSSLETNTAPMDNLLAGSSLEETAPYSHDNVLSNDEVSGVQGSVSNEDTQPAALLDRIGSAKVYLLPDSAQTRTAKVR